MPKSNNKKQRAVSSKTVQPTQVRNNNKKKPVKSSAGVTLSAQSWQYARSLMNPFEYDSGAYIPSFPAMPSKKMTTWVRGTFQNSNANGYGFVVCQPFNGVVNDMAAVAVTGSTWNGTTLTGNATTGVNCYTSNSPYTGTTFASAKAQSRLVSAGIRIRSITAPLYANGQVAALQQPSHSDLTGRGFSDLAGYQRALVDRIGTDWINVIYTPVDPADLNTYVPTGGSSVTAQNPFMAIMVSGTTGVVQTFEFEYFAHFELNGQNILDVTPSIADLQGLSTVTSITANQGDYGFIGRVDTGRLWNSLVSFGTAALMSGAAGVANLGIRTVSRQLDRNTFRLTN